MTTQLTRAAFNYLAGLYENCVDRGLNVVEIQAYLSRKGVNRPLLQVKNELSNVFQFPGYVEAHPAPAIPPVAEWDKAIEQGSDISSPRKQPRKLLVATTKRSYNGCNGT